MAFAQAAWLSAPERQAPAVSASTMTTATCSHCPRMETRLHACKHGDVGLPIGLPRELKLGPRSFYHFLSCGMGVGGRRTFHWQGSESCRLLPSSALFLGPALHSLQGLHKEGVKANPGQAQTQSLYGTKEAVGQREPGAISEVFMRGAVASQRIRKHGPLEE